MVNDGDHEPTLPDVLVRFYVGRSIHCAIAEWKLSLPTPVVIRARLGVETVRREFESGMAAAESAAMLRSKLLEISNGDALIDFVTLIARVIDGEIDFDADRHALRVLLDGIASTLRE